MEQLSTQDEALVLQFNGLLWGVSGPEDMFPPDDITGVREPLGPIPPHDIEPMQIMLAAVYDISQARKNKASCNLSMLVPCS